MHYRRWHVHGDASMTKKRANGAGYIQGGYAGKQINGVRKFDHIAIAEGVLGRPLPDGAVVHHANENRLDNNNTNLVICPDRAYHNLLHVRLDAFKACGNPDWRKCRHCGQYDDLDRLREYHTKTGSFAYWHMECARSSARAKYLEKRNAVVY